MSDKMDCARGVKLRILIISNVNNKCGISFYSRILGENLSKNHQVFFLPTDTSADRINRLNPDVVSIQHDPGLFPCPKKFFNLLTMKPPCCVTYHSMRKGHNLIIGLPWVKYSVVHTTTCKQMIPNSVLIPPGCQKKECNNKPEFIFTFGFKNSYKGFDDVPKGTIVPDHFLSDGELDYFFNRTSVCIFPYKRDSFFGASGAARTAMGYHVPVVASFAPLFDDLPVIRTNDIKSEVDKIVNDRNLREEIIKKQDEYVENNSWEKMSELYEKFFIDIIRQKNGD